jgi:hypothetical protein
MMLLSSPSSSRVHQKTASRQSIHHSQVQMLFSCFINASAVSLFQLQEKPLAVVIPCEGEIGAPISSDCSVLRPNDRGFIEVVRIVAAAAVAVTVCAS